MLPKEMVKSALRFKDLDRIPVIPPTLSWWAVNHFGYTAMEVFKDPWKGADAQLKTLKILDFDGVESFWDWYCILEPLGCKTKIIENGNPLVLDFPIKKTEDLKSMVIPDFNKDWRIETSIKTAAFLKEKADNRYLYATPLGPITLAGLLRGVDNLMRDIIRRPDFVHDLMAFSRDVLLEHAKLYIPYMDAIMYCDPTASGDLISPKHAQTFHIPYLKQLIEDTKKLGADVLIHICGNTSNRLEYLADIRADGFSLDHIVDLSFAREKLRDKMAIIGNVDPATLLTETPMQIEKLSKDAIAKAGKKGCILAAGCDTPLGSSVENIKAMVNTAYQITHYNN